MVQAIPKGTIEKLAEVVLHRGAKKATKIISPTLTAKVTQRGKRSGRDSQVTLLLTIGSPNYAERKFIRQCRLAGEPFPVKKPLIKWPKPGRNRRKDRKAA